MKRNDKWITVAIFRVTRALIERGQEEQRKMSPIDKCEGLGEIVDNAVRQYFKRKGIKV